MLESAQAEFRSPTLQLYRQRIEEADRLLVEAISIRLQIVAELLSWKRREGLPTRDLDQELEVIGRARRWARGAGAPPELVERVLSLLIEAGKAQGVAEPAQR